MSFIETEQVFNFRIYKESGAGIPKRRKYYHEKSTLTFLIIAVFFKMS